MTNEVFQSLVNPFTSGASNTNNAAMRGKPGADASFFNKKVFKPIRGGKQAEKREKSPEVLDFRNFMNMQKPTEGRSSSNVPTIRGLNKK